MATGATFLPNVRTQNRPPDFKLHTTAKRTPQDQTTGAKIASFTFLATSIATVRNYF